MDLNRQAFCFLVELKLNWVKRNSRSEIFSEKTLLKMFLNFTRQQLYRIIYFNNLPGCRPTTISAETLRYWWIFRHFCEFKIVLEGNFYKTPVNSCFSIRSHLSWNWPEPKLLLLHGCTFLPWAVITRSEMKKWIE